jgi:hypothetical protein
MQPLRRDGSASGRRFNKIAADFSMRADKCLVPRVSRPCLRPPPARPLIQQAPFFNPASAARPLGSVAQVVPASVGVLRGQRGLAAAQSGHWH